ncbi:Theileria-specific sub-telomeric protein, SVSP family, putative [Theileria annulata]|uniref:Theileria-specific sub-telomeric protein, SVSP family, putative n=1 Tax=Theileria annulata TaxID=5874 RepID=Q4UFT7_THEAN|nr:Theileria-specific sub-telomeric protein, SVSP family, putative [Theileria annulata]CAI74029.1 Theileria-specific sub-telomeric protein, SVSP family, putative [Theileria annulata]|eukprot:XP_951761.1 Theileria-specific sub-telomeric protein, SVSP family, putative [Theileria annulata]
MDFVTYIYIIVLLLLQSNECADKTTQEQNQEGQYDPLTLEQYGPELEPQPILYYVPHYQFQPQPDQQHIPVYYGPDTYQPVQYQAQEQHTEPTSIPQPQQPYQPTPPQYYTGYGPPQQYYQHQPQPEQSQPYYPGPQYPVQQQYYQEPQYQPVPQYYPPPQPQEYQLPQQGIGYYGPQYQPQYYPGYQPQPYPQTGYQLQYQQPISQPLPQGPPPHPQPQQPYYTGPPTQPLQTQGPGPTTIQPQPQAVQHPQPSQPSQVTQSRQPIGPQYQPRHTGPLRQPSNLRPGILGPAPGTLRFPPQLQKKPRQQNIRTPTQRPTQRPTQQPTKEPTQRPTKEPPTQQTTEPSGLQPETVPVEIGSDEDEEPLEPPKGPGDGDKPPDKPEEGEDEDDGDEDDDDEEEKKPSKDVKICNTITFMKKNSEGKLVPMSEGDYTVISYSEYNIKYVFNAELEAVLCDEETIFTHLAGRDYCKSVIHKRHHGSFNFRRDDGFVLVKFKNGKWKFRARNNPDYVRLYALDNEGKEVELDEKSYYLKFTSSGSFKYEFLQNVRLTKFIIKDKVVWEKTITDNHPSAVAVTERFNAIIYFDTYTRVYGRRKGKYRFLFTRPNIKYIKK